MTLDEINAEIVADQCKKNSDRKRVMPPGVHMPTISIPSGQATVTYSWKTGPIDWDGRTVQAFIFKGVPLEGGHHANPAAAVLINLVILQNSDLATGLWAAFVKSPYGMPVPEWELVGAGIGQHHPLSEDEALPESIPESVVRQLESVFQMGDP